MLEGEGSSPHRANKGHDALFLLPSCTVWAFLAVRYHS